MSSPTTRHRRRLRPAAGLVALLLINTACGGVHLYNKANHDLAQRAEAAFKEAELAKSLDDERKRLAEMLAREVELARRHTVALRDAELVSIIGGDTLDNSWNELATRAEKRLRDLIGKDVTALDRIQTRLAVEASLDGTALRYRMARPAAGDPAPTCPWHPPDPVFSRPELEEAFETYQNAVRAFDVARPAEARRACTAYQALGPAASDPVLPCIFSDPRLEGRFYLHRQQCATYVLLDHGLPGRIGSASRAIAAVEGASNELRDRLAKLRRDYDAQVKRVEAAETVQWREDLEALHGTLDAFASAASATARLLEATGFADLAKAGLIEKLEREWGRIDAVVEAFVSGKPGTDTKAERSLAIAEGLGLVAKAATRPQVAHLILRRERLRLDVELLKREVGAAEERLRLQKRHLEALVLEASILSEALRSVDEARTGGCVKGPLFRDFERAQASPGPDAQRCAELTGRALGRYANSFSAARVAQEELDYRILGVRHGVALDRSELALGQWENLVGTPLNQLVALYAAGLTPDEIARFLLAIGNAAGLTFIGVGVQ
jgi:hypothetical protein